MIHPTALIDPTAVIAPDVTIGPFCQVAAGVELHSGVTLAAHVVIESSVTLGEGVRVFAFAKIGGRCPVTIGERSTVREFCQLGVQGEGDAPLHVAADVFLMAYTQLYSGVRIGANSILTNTVTLKENAACEERVIIGGLSTLETGCTLGTGIMVGGASQITADMPPFCLIEGNTASIRGLNLIGLRRRFPDKTDIESIKTAFRRVAKGEISRADARMHAESTTNPQAGRFLRFVAEYRTPLVRD